MPTKHPRHMVTETPAVRAALEPLRAELGGERLDLGELVVLGAHAKLHAVRQHSEEAASARRWLADRIRAADVPVDPSVIDAAKRQGLVDPDAAA